MEVLRKWDVTLSDEEEEKIKNEVFGPEWENVVGPLGTISVSQSIEFMNTMINILKGET